MLYDVSVIRTSTASLTIRVDADDPETARGMALEMAGDQDYAGCVVEYDFDAENAVEVKDAPGRADETLPKGCDQGEEMAGEVNLASKEARCPDLSDGTCALCPTVFTGVSDEVIDAGWLPSYFISDDECEGPVCPNCAAQFIVFDPKGGEATLSVDGEYVSVWDGGVEVRTKCVCDPRTRKVVIDRSQNANVQVLDREYVVLNGREYGAVNEEYRGEYTPEKQARMFFYE